MVKIFCKVMGFILIVAAIIGFVNPQFLGLHLSAWHSVIHLISGAVALYFGYLASLSTARTFCWVFGAVYLILGLLGFIAPSLMAAILQAQPSVNLAADNVLHLLLGVAFLAAGFLRGGAQLPQQPMRTA
ncbi:MAG TPA: DUF4383 domain-containing protein [Gammaproteobacteria bacterium]|nr:DUF4383 domain-containing protein [Gammaproteobacteria bacterium]